MPGWDAPFEFVRVTDTSPTLFASELSVNGCVYKKVVPKSSELVDWYQVVKGAVRSTVKSVVFRLAPEAGVKWNSA